MRTVIIILTLIAMGFVPSYLLAQDSGNSGHVGGGVFDASQQPKPEVPVLIRALSGSQAGQSIRVQTDSQGQYLTALDDGQWIVSVCGSAKGYTPLYWRVNIENGDIVNFESVNNTTTTITSYESTAVVTDLEGATGSPLTGVSEDYAIYLGDEVTLTGEGFGCSGKIVLDFGAHGRWSILNFEWVSEREIKFNVPRGLFDYIGLQPPEAQEELPPQTRLRAQLYYVNGPTRSNYLTVEIQKARVQAEAEPIAGVQQATTVQTQEVATSTAPEVPAVDVPEGHTVYVEPSSAVTYVGTLTTGRDLVNAGTDRLTGGTPTPVH